MRGLIEQSQGMAAYLLATTADRLGIEAVAEWWEERGNGNV